MLFKKMLFMTIISFLLTTTLILVINFHNGGKSFSTISIQAVFDSEISKNQLAFYRSSIKRNLAEIERVPNTENRWETERGTTATRIIIKINKNLLNHLKHLSLQIGNKKVIYTQEEFLAEWTRDSLKENKDLPLFHFQSPKDLRTETVLNRLIPLLNWGLLWNFQQVFYYLMTNTLLILFLTFFFPFNGFSNALMNLDPRKRWPLMVFPLIGLSVSLFIIFNYVINFFWMDQLALMKIMHGIDEGSLTFMNFWDQHNEHRVVTTRLVFLLFTFIKPFNNYFMTAFGQLAQLFACFLIIKSLFHNHVQEKWKLLAMTGVTSFLIFSPIHAENTILPFHQQWHLSFLGLIMSCYGLSKTSRYLSNPYFLSGWICSYLSAPNWMVLVPLVFSFRLYKHLEDLKKFSFKNFIKKEFKQYFLFILLSAMLLIAYFYGWHGTSKGQAFWHGPVLVLKSFFALIGNQTPPGILAIFTGMIIFIIGMAFLIINISYKKIIHYDIFTLLLLLGFGSAAMTSFGRGGSGADGVVLSRYVNMSTPVWIACFGIAISNIQNLKSYLTKILFLSFATLICFQSVVGINTAQKFKEKVNKDYQVLIRSYKEQNHNYLLDSTIQPKHYLKNPGFRQWILDQYNWMVKKGYYKFDK